jgi:hypothetical protein
MAARLMTGATAAVASQKVSRKTTFAVSHARACPGIVGDQHPLAEEDGTITRDAWRS